MKVKFALAMLAALCFAAVPVFAQHGDHGGGGHDGVGGGMHSEHSSGHDADERHHGGHDNDANERAGKHGKDHDSSHGSFASKLTSNSQLASKLQALLPPGTNL